MDPPSGIVYHPSPDDSNLAHLPLESVSVKAWMVDVSARICLTQVFANSSETSTGRAKYVFPLPARAAVCAFELEHADGRIITGIAKEKLEAAQMFDKAVQEGRTAGLVEWVTDDTFVISVGSIAAKQTVVARLTFVMDLLDEGIRDHVRLQLPMAVAPRYGQPPSPTHSASAAPASTPLTLQADIQMSDTIHDIRSPTHPGLTLMRYKTRAGRRSQRRMSASFASPTFLTSDFVLSVHAAGLDQPRCFAEVNSGLGADANTETIAFRLTLVPTFKLPRVVSPEFIFVIDRSGSMSGPSIATAKQTLAMLLNLLPNADTKFNIFSFGTHTTSLWPRSVALSQLFVNQAVTHIQSMDADYGGTEIAQALGSALNSRDTQRSTAIFVLTDGGVNDRNDPFAMVRTAVSSSIRHAPLRVFTLGIGAGVSSDMCERLAREGNGECLFALNAESITGKCARLLNAGRTRAIESVSIDWQPSPNPRHRSSGSVSFSSPRRNRAGDGLQQAPWEIQKIYPGMRFVVSAIMPHTVIPNKVVLYAKAENVDEPIELVVPVTEVKPFKDASSTSTVPLVHVLAARSLITELDEDRAVSGSPPANTNNDAAHANADVSTKQSAITKLGLDYQLVSRYTSFVAVESDDTFTRRQSRRFGHGHNNRHSWARGRARAPTRQPPPTADTIGDTNEDTEWTGISVVDDIISGISQLFSAFLNLGSTRQNRNARSNTNAGTGNGNGIPGSFPLGRPRGLGSVSSEGGGDSDNDNDGDRDNYPLRNGNYSTDTFSTLSSLDGSSTSSRWSRSRSPTPPRPALDLFARSPSPVLTFTQVPQLQPHNAHLTASIAPSRLHTQPIPPQAFVLLNFQQCDGSFPPSALSMELSPALRAPPAGVESTVWATALAYAYLAALLGGSEPDLLDCLQEKAREFVEAQGRQFEELVELAKGRLLAPVQ
ncbi:hypothetical protein BJ138DRAFT_1068391 [Hygrophoropsis aurantiaca]|uniref:Uncharacterized protein n=1 Tax=Hygrophoropsis aurantiaca TaxID=72124 RepID=A0ACB8A5A2_9AGAM|nr:hypothetical protein BJ138DRAFT_1068391 [Hygrophoropsis aurantiaca]